MTLLSALIGASPPNLEQSNEEDAEFALQKPVQTGSDMDGLTRVSVLSTHSVMCVFHHCAVVPLWRVCVKLNAEAGQILLEREMLTWAGLLEISMGLQSTEKKSTF